MASARVSNCKLFKPTFSKLNWCVADINNVMNRPSNAVIINSVGKHCPI